jgi:hypothetical protein
VDVYTFRYAYYFLCGIASSSGLGSYVGSAFWSRNGGLRNLRGENESRRGRVGSDEVREKCMTLISRYVG